MRSRGPYYSMNRLTFRLDSSRTSRPSQTPDTCTKVSLYYNIINTRISRTCFNVVDCESTLLSTTGASKIYMHLNQYCKCGSNPHGRLTEQLFELVHRKAKVMLLSYHPRQDVRSRHSQNTTNWPTIGSSKRGHQASTWLAKVRLGTSRIHPR